MGRKLRVAFKKRREVGKQELHRGKRLSRVHAMGCHGWKDLEPSAYALENGAVTFKDDNQAIEGTELEIKYSVIK